MYNVNVLPSHLGSQRQFFARCNHLVQFFSALDWGGCVVHKRKIHQLQAKSFSFWEEEIDDWDKRKVENGENDVRSPPDVGNTRWDDFHHYE